jgi:hypothetical protein
MISSTHLVRSFDSSEPAYYRAFQLFLQHTDQKEKARQWLEDAVAQLPKRITLIDAGAGNGALLRWLSAHFETSIGVEPNPSLYQELAPHCTHSQQASILESELEAMGDLVVCSHVFYYIPKQEWADNLQRLLSWVADEGQLVIALQNPRTDCMEMVRHFTGQSFDLSELVPLLNDLEGGPYNAKLERVQATIKADDLQTACQVAEFVLNVLPIPEDLTWFELEQYVEDRFADLGGGYSFSCHQDFLHIIRHQE